MRVLTRTSDGAAIAEHRRLDCDGKLFVLWAPYTANTLRHQPKLSNLVLSSAADFDARHFPHRTLPCGHEGDPKKSAKQRCSTCTAENPVPECKEGRSHSWAMGGGGGMYSVKCRTCGLLAMREHNGHVYKWRKQPGDPWTERQRKA